jgi:hypothetical protein
MTRFSHTALWMHMLGMLLSSGSTVAGELEVKGGELAVWALFESKDVTPMHPWLDFDGNLAFDAADIALAERALAGKLGHAASCLTSADLNFNGVLDEADIDGMWAMLESMEETGDSTLVALPLTPEGPGCDLAPVVGSQARSYPNHDVSIVLDPYYAGMDVSFQLIQGDKHTIGVSGPDKGYHTGWTADSATSTAPHDETGSRPAEARG